MANADTLKGLLDAIGDAIRAKTGGSAKLTLAEMPDEIAGISGGGKLDWSQLNFRTSDARFGISVTQVDLSGVDFSNSRGNQLARMFYNCSSLTSVTGVEDITFGGAVQGSYAFSGAKLTSIDSTKIRAPFAVTTMANCFQNCTRTEYIDLSNIDFSSCTAAGSMLAGCTRLATLKTSETWGALATCPFPVAMQDENGNQYSAGDDIPAGAHTYTATA